MGPLETGSISFPKDISTSPSKITRFESVYKRVVKSKKNMDRRDGISRRLIAKLPGDLDEGKLKEVFKIVLGESYVDSEYLSPNVLKVQLLTGLAALDTGTGCDGKFGKISYAALVKYIRNKKELRENAKIQQIIPSLKEGSQKRADLMRQVTGGGKVSPVKTPAKTASVARNIGLDSSSETVEAIGLKHNQIRLVGDSITAKSMGYARYFKVEGRTIDAKLRGKTWNYRVVRRGGKKIYVKNKQINDYAYYQGARNTRQVIYRMKKERASGALDNLKVVASLIGTNDIYTSKSVDYNKRPIEKDPLVKKLNMLWSIFLSKGIKLFVFTIPPQGRFLRNYFRKLKPAARKAQVIRACKERIKRVNKWIKAQASKNIVVIDLYSQMDDGKGSIKKMFDRDGIHPNARGANAMAGMLSDMIAKGKHKSMDKYS